jgi:hypothetical protein
MLARVNRISGDNRNVMITKLDIDDFGSIIPIKELELQLPSDDDSVVQTLRNSPYAAIFTESDDEENDHVIVLANAISTEELNKEKERTIDKVNESKVHRI